MYIVCCHMTLNSFNYNSGYKLDWSDVSSKGIIGFMPIFETYKQAEEYSKNRYEILEIK